jgi:hypothetical protein
VGGRFTIASAAATNIAKWDGTNWSALGLGVNGSVGALAISGSNVYAGGGFTMAGGIPANYVAKWDGHSWSALGAGLSGGVYALAVSGGELYAYAGGQPPLAKWDGSSWSALATNLSGGVNALVGWGTNVVAGGYFAWIDGNYVGNAAQWNGSNWSPVAGGVMGTVWALAVSGSNLFAGGDFYLPRQYFAVCDGGSWSELGSGINGGASGLAVSGTNLFVSGAFTVAGGKAAGRLARVILDDVLAIVGYPESKTVMPGSDASFSVSAVGLPPLTYQWRKNGTNLVDGGNVSGATATTLTISHAQGADAGPYSVVVTNAYGSQTADTVLTVLVPPNLLVAADGCGFTNGQFGFLVSCGYGQLVSIEGSTNLVDWVPLDFFAQYGELPVYFSDPDATNNPARFYRAVVYP